MAATIARMALRPALRTLPARLVSSAPVMSRVNIISSQAAITTVKIPCQVQSRSYSGKDPLNLQYIHER